MMNGLSKMEVYRLGIIYVFRREMGGWKVNVCDSECRMRIIF